MNQFQSIAPDVKLGKAVRLARFINLYGCTIDEGTSVGTFVEVQKNAFIGKKCKVSSHTFICEGVHIGDFCFIGHSVVFINDKFPTPVNEKGELESEMDWAPRFLQIKICNRVSIGSNATILGGVEIGEGAVIGAGSVVTKDVPPHEVWAGNPARYLRKVH